jgi:hypothetical protein
MANLIRLKQIESGSSLQTSAQIGTDFSASVNNIVSQSIETTFSASIVQIITNNVGAVLPDGVISSSAQIVLGDTTGQLSGSRVIGDIAATSVNYEDIIGLPTLVSGSEQVIDILIPLNQHSASINQFTASLDSTYATDAEVYVSQSNINIDMGEW